MEHKNPPHRPTYVNLQWLVDRGRVPSTWEEDILNLGREGKNKMYFANYLNISRDVMYKLIDRDPKFKKVINKAMELSEEWWIEKGRQAWEDGSSQKLNSNFFKYYMSNVYRDNWRVNVDITTDGDKIKSDDKIRIEIIKPIIEEENDDKDEQNNQQ
jgi:hypothetical protein